jgi:hypothetical protein
VKVNSTEELAAIWIPIDGRREVHLVSGLVAQTNPGSLSLSKTSGSGTIAAFVSGYYFE